MIEIIKKVFGLNDQEYQLAMTWSVIALFALNIFILINLFKVNERVEAARVYIEQLENDNDQLEDTQVGSQAYEDWHNQ